MNRGLGGATRTETVAALASTGIATVATFVRSDELLAPTGWDLSLHDQGFTGLAISRDLPARDDPRGGSRLVAAGVAFAAAAALFLFCPAFN